MIRYKKYQNQTKSTPLSGKWLARAVADETLDTRALAEHMAKHWSVTTNVVGLRLKCRATGTLAINQLKLEAQLKELSPYDIEGGNTGGGDEEERPGEL